MENIQHLVVGNSFFFQAEDGIRDKLVTGVQTCALPIFTVAVSMFLSAINALTLSPALCGIFLRPRHGPRRGPIGMVMRAIDWVRDAYGAVVARIVRFSVIGLVMVGLAGFGTVSLLKVTPTGFLPEDDQGAFFVVIQMPGGASVGRTLKVVHETE